MRRFALFIALVGFFTTSPSAWAWSTSGSRISIQPTQNERSACAVPDGAGGVFVASLNDTVSQVQLQRVNSSGAPMWGPGGVIVAPPGERVGKLALVPDGTGGEYLITAESVPSAPLNHLRVYRLTAVGTMAWGSPTDLLGTSHLGMGNPEAIADGGGGVFVFWTDTGPGGNWVRGQHVNSAGSILWAAGGAIVGGTGGGVSLGDVELVGDGSGGSVVFWRDSRAGNGDIYAQRVNAAGVTQWLPSTGVPVCTELDGQDLDNRTGICAAANDGAGGFVVAWDDYRSGFSDIYAQKLNASGVPQWTADGVAVATRPDAEVLPRVVADGTGGTVIAWGTIPSDPSPGYVSLQNLNGGGSPLWASNGIPPMSSGPEIGNYSVCGDGTGGVIVAWDDGSQVRAQHIVSGRLLLGSAGWRVAPFAATETLPTVAPDASGGAVVVWSDHRDGVYTDLYTQRVYAAGRPGVTTTAGLAAQPQSSPALVPLEHTARLDVVFSETNGQIVAYRPNGTMVPGFPIVTGAVLSSGPVAVSDCNGDGHFELFVGTANGDVLGYSEYGTALPGWPKLIGTGSPAFVAIGPLGAGGAEAIVALSGSHLDAYRPDGSSLGGLFPVTLSGAPAPTFTRPPAIGDLTGDGVREIVAAAGGTMYVFNASGLFEFSLTLPAPETVSDAPTLADVDLDGQLEIAVPTTGGRLFLLNANGSLRPGYPITEIPDVPLTSVAFANVVGTTDIDLAYADWKGHAHLRVQNGTQAGGWPHATDFAGDLLAAPVVGSLNGGSGDIAIGSDDSFGYAWTNVFGSVTGWPYDLGGPCTVSPAIGDLDQDGLSDVVFLSSTQMVVMTTFGSYGGLLGSDPRSRWPMAGYDPERTGCLACSGLPGSLGVDPPQPYASAEFAPPAPNPAHGSTTLRFTSGRAGRVRIAIFDAAGREVARPVDGELGAGTHVAHWDAASQAPGVYLARLETPVGTAMRRIAVIR